MLFATSSFALTNKERGIVTHARDQLKIAISQFEEANARATLADQQASSADQHAADVDAKATELQRRIDEHYANEQKLSSQVNTYKGFWDSGHKLWGLGAIGLGIGILFKHLFILAGILIALGILIWVASMFFPIIGVGLGMASTFIKSILAKFKKT